MTDPGQQYHEHWSGNPPTRYSVLTTFRDTNHPNETRSEWEKRHNGAVAALKAEHPPL